MGAQRSFVVLQGVTVGSNKGKYPSFGKGVGLTANSSIIGDCNIGDRVNLSTRATIFDKNLEDDTTAFTDVDTGGLKTKKSKKSYAQQFYNIDLNKI